MIRFGFGRFLPLYAGLAAVLVSAGTSMAQPAKVKVGVFNSISDVGIFVALEKGFFRGQDLDVEVTQVDTGAAVSAGLASEGLDVAGDSPTSSLYNGARQGIGFRIVADKGSTPPGRGYQAIVVRSDLAASIKTPADLKGRKFGLTGYMNGVSNEATMHRLLTGASMKEDDVSFVALSYPDVLASLGTKAVDAGILIEPLATRAVDQKIGVIWKRADEVYPNQQYGVLVFGPGLLKRPDVAKRFMVAYLQGVRFYNDALAGKAPRAELVAILARHTSVKNPDLYEHMAFPGLDPNGAINEKGMREDMAYFVAAGRLRQPVDLTLVVDQSFSREAVKILGRYE